ncbi:MAG: hypothetical protein HFH41_03950 [Lachnospiraceae bacterium]|nr:hypothetical protein [Lachnospiraceae bacterium]
MEKFNEMENEYRFNERFREYVDKYCKKHGCDTEEALKHAIVREVYLQYTDV